MATSFDFEWVLMLSEAANGIRYHSIWCSVCAVCFGIEKFEVAVPQKNSWKPAVYSMFACNSPHFLHAWAHKIIHQSCPLKQYIDSIYMVHILHIRLWFKLICLSGNSPIVGWCKSPTYPCDCSYFGCRMVINPLIEIYDMDGHKSQKHAKTMFWPWHIWPVAFARWGFDHRQPAVSDQDQEVCEGNKLWPSRGQGIITKWFTRMEI